MTAPSPFAAPWHHRSWHEFLNAGLPGLLAERLPLAGYHVDTGEGPTCTVRVFLTGTDGDVENAYELPQPDVDGVFHMQDGPMVVMPRAEAVDLAEAEVLCCGERALAFVDERLRTAAPDERPADAGEARAWLPLDDWLGEFVRNAVDALPNLSGVPALPLLQRTNWLDVHSHLRRVMIPDREQAITDGHVGRVCVVETPEGPNIGRILTVARGADIRDRRLVIIDDSTVGRLGISSASVPFLEHDDCNRALMGCNMMRQWLPPAEREPALIRTGFEPEVTQFWNGHNLLTAFITWDADAFEDAVVISESASRRMACPEPLTVGDKLSHRHGAKGVISRVLPDSEMPALPDGTPVELIQSLASLPSRLSLGPLREATLSRVAHARGEPIDVPPFAAPSDDEMRSTLEQAGFAADGMEQLRLHGEPLDHRSTVGWVYWGCTLHVVREKIHFAVTADQVPWGKLHASDSVWFRPQTQGDVEALALVDVGAHALVHEHFSLRAEGHAREATITEGLTTGPVEPAPPPSPQLARLQARLAAAGIDAALAEGQLRLRLCEPDASSLELAEPTAHPWLPEHRIQRLGRVEAVEAWPPLAEANERLRRALSSGAPAGLVDRARGQLRQHLSAWCDEIVGPPQVRFHARISYSARSVMVPGGELDHDQIGVPEEIAWALFSPHATRRLRSLDAVASRSEAAAAALDEAMADSWIVMFAPLAVTPQCFIAFRPQRIPGDAIRVSPLVTQWTNADFDGDQTALFLPVTEAGQQDAEKLTLAAHFLRDPAFVGAAPQSPYRGWLHHDAMWGLAHLARTAEGRRAADEAAGFDLCGDGILDSSRLTRLLGEGVAAVDAHQRLQRLGFSAARRAGASMGPFFGSRFDLPPKPDGDDDDALQAYNWEAQAAITAFSDYDDDESGPVCLGVECGSRANWEQLSRLAAANVGRARSSFSQRDGQPPELFFRRFAPAAWEGVHRVHEEAATWNSVAWKRTAVGGYSSPDGLGILARARAARRPGVVLARAAAQGATDPLTDPVSRLWAGIASGDRA